MQRLFKPQYLTVSLVMVVCLALMTLVLPRLPDKACEMPIWVLVLGEFLYTVIASIFAQFQALRQSIFNLKLMPGLISLGLVLLISAIGVIVSPVSAWVSNGNVSIGLAQLTVINLAILFSIFTLTNLGEHEVVETVTDEESSQSNTTNIKRLTQIRMKAVHPKGSELDDEIIEQLSQPLNLDPSVVSDPSSATDPTLPTVRNSTSTPVLNSYQLVNKSALKPPSEAAKPNVQKPGQSTSRQAVDISTVEKLLLSGTQSAQKLKPAPKELSPEIRRLASVNAKTQNKTSLPKKPVSGTISKLQSLSASGTGAANTTQTGLESSSGLKSVLDRLDSIDSVDSVENLIAEHAAQEASSAVPLEWASSGSLFNAPVDEDMDNLFAKIAPDAKPEINKTESLPESFASEQSILEREVLEKIEPIADLQQPDAQAQPGLFKEKVDSTVDEIFLNMAPPSAQREVSIAKNNAEEFSHPQAVIDHQSADASSSYLFKQPVDNQVDDIFAKIAPEAQPAIDIDNKTYESKSAEKTVGAHKFAQPNFAKSQAVEYKFAETQAAQTKPEEYKFAETQVAQPKPEQFKFAEQKSAEIKFEDLKLAESKSVEMPSQSYGFTDVKLPEPEFSAPQSSPDLGEPKLFKEKVDNQVDDIFSGMAPAEAQKEVKDRIKSEPGLTGKPAQEVTGDRSPITRDFDPYGTDQKTTVPELKDFGRLSSRSSAEKESSTQAGTMKTIGKLLIDSQSVENIIKKADSGKITINLPSAKVISKTRGQGIQNLLETIDTYNAAGGSMLVGGDGLVIASTFVSSVDRDGVGVLAHGMLSNTNLVTMKLDLGNLEQMILVTNTKETKLSSVTTIFTDVEVGTLAVFFKEKVLGGLDALLESINSIASG